jgi:hypothetical protein
MGLVVRHGARGPTLCPRSAADPGTFHVRRIGARVPVRRGRGFSDLGLVSLVMCVNRNVVSFSGSLLTSFCCHGVLEVGTCRLEVLSVSIRLKGGRNNELTLKERPSALVYVCILRSRGLFCASLAEGSP